MKTGLYFRYWLLVALPEALAAVWATFSMRRLAWVIGIIALVILVAGVFGYSTSDLAQLLMVQFAANSWLGWVLPIALVLMVFVIVPPQLHNSLGGFVEYPFELVFLKPKPRTENEIRASSIEVRNITSTPVHDCFLTLDAIAHEDGSPVVFEGPRKLTWSAREGAGGERPVRELGLSRGNPRIANLAQTVFNHADVIQFTFWQGGLDLKSGRYRVDVTPHGEWKDHTVVGRTIVGILEYRGNNQLAIRDIDEEDTLFPLPTPLPGVSGKGGAS